MAEEYTFLVKKADFVKEISNKTGISKEQANKALELFMNKIITTMRDGGKVELVGFGSFIKRPRQAREGRNPKTGESIFIPPSEAISFKAGKRLKDFNPFPVED